MPHGAEGTPGMFAWMDGKDAADTAQAAAIAGKLDSTVASSIYVGLDFGAFVAPSLAAPSVALDPNPAANPALYNSSTTGWVTAATTTAARVAALGPHGEYVYQITIPTPWSGQANYGPQGDIVPCTALAYTVAGLDVQVPVDMTVNICIGFYTGTSIGTLINYTQLAIPLKAGVWRSLRVGDWAPPTTAYRSVWVRFDNSPITAGGTVQMTKEYMSNIDGPYNDAQTPLGNLSGVVACIGDSITQGNQGTGEPYPAHLEERLVDVGVQVNNLGRGGEASAGIALRAGAFQPLVTFPSNQIPATTVATAVTLTPTVHWNSAAFTYKIEVGGVPGTLTTTGATATFARTWAGTAVDLLPGGTPVRLPQDLWSDLLIIEAGPNDIDTGNVEDVIKSVGAMVELRRQIGRPFLVLGLLNNATEPDGTSGYTFVTNANTALANRLGSQFLDIRTYLIQHGLVVAGITPTVDDTAAIALDLIPPSLMHTDGIHPNDAGRLVIAQLIEQFVRARLIGLGFQGKPALPSAASIVGAQWIRPAWAAGSAAAWSAAQRAVFVRFSLDVASVMRYMLWVCSVASGNVQVGVVQLSGTGHTLYAKIMDSGVIACPVAGNIRTDLGSTVLQPGDYALFMWADNITFQTRRGTDSAATIFKGAALVSSLATGVPASGTLGYSQELVSLALETDC